MRKLLSVLFSTLQGGVRGGLLLLALIISTSAIYASDTQVDGIWYDFNSIEELVDFSAQGYTNQQNVSSYQGNNFSVTFDKGTNSNEPKYFDKGTAIRVYGGGCFIVASEATITHIVIGFGSSDGSNVISTDIGTFSDDIWSGNSNSVKFMIGGTSGHRRIQKLTVITSGSTNTSVTYQGSTYDSYGGEYFGSVVIPETVTYNGTTYSVISIGNYAFSGCPSLTSVTIPNSVKSIRSGAFDGCSSLTSINVGSNNPNYSSVDGVLFNKDKTTLIQYPGGKQGAYTIPDSVTSIGSSAFAGSSSLTSVTIPNSVTSTGEWAFFGCSSLTSINVGSNNPNYSSVDGVLFNKDKTTLIQYPGGKQCAYTIPDSVTSIGSGAFYNCSVLTSIAIPNSVKSIGKRAFDGCSTLDKISVDATTPPTLGLNAFSSAPICYIPSGTLAAYEASDWASQVSEFVENPTRQQILYTSYNGNIVAPRNSYVFGANIVSNKYKDGQGVITFDGLVTSIGDHAFYNCYSLTSVTIPNSVTSIGNYAFGDCHSLKSVTIPNSVTTIGDDAFYGCDALTSVTINSDTIVNNAYSSSSNISRIFGSQVTEYIIGDAVKGIGDYAFKGCSSLKSVTIPNSVTSIANFAFSDCSSLTSVTIPNSVTSIGERAFDGCSTLDKISVDATTPPTLGLNAFSSAPICYIPGGTLAAYEASDWASQVSEFVENPTRQQILYTSYDGHIVAPRNSYVFGANIVSNTYKDGQGIITFDGPVTSIGNSAFQYCDALTSITIPNSVTSIGDSAFQYCDALTSITIPNSVTSIGDYAFKGCSSLTSVTIGESVISIGERVFDGCFSLTSPLYNAHCFAYMPTSYSGAYTIPKGIEQIAGYAFYGCDALTSITIPNSVTSIGDYAFSYCSSLTSVTIPNSVKSIGERAFDGCSTLDKISVDAITPPTLGLNAFSSAPICYILSGTLAAYEASDWASQVSEFVEDPTRQQILYTSYDGNIVAPDDSYAFGANIVSNTYKDGQGVITFDGPVTSIGDGAFEFCSSLTSITIPNSVTSIGNQAFQYCEALTSVTIGESVTSIGHMAFYACFSLTSVTIPNSVTSIGESAFQSCSFTSITIPNSVTSIGDYAFNDCSSLTSVTIPNSVTSIGMCTFCGCSSLTSVTIPNSVTSIGERAFYGCSSLTSVAIGESVTSIGEKAFYGCSSLTSITLPNSVTIIGGYAFFDCPSLTSITCEAETPPTLDSDAFYTVSKSIPIYVPCGCVEAYKSASGWNVFKNIQVPLAEYSISLTINDSNMGTAKVDKNTACGNQISAIANYGYHFVRWSDGNTDNPRSLGLTQDTILTAEFAPNKYTITTVSSDTQRGTTQGDTTVNYLEYITISATASYGYHFVQWNDGNKVNPRQVQVTKDMTYTATFDKNIYNIFLQSNNGTIESVTHAAYLDNVTMMANANYGYHFAQWSDGVTDNPRTFVITQDTTFTAEFAPNKYTITTVSSDTQRGTTQGDTTVNYLEYITISAAASYGYHFVQWNDGNKVNPRQVQVTKDMTYSAYFDKNTYAISLSCNEEQGRVEGVTSAEYLDRVTILATANYGYHFAQWSDGVTDNPRTFVITQDTTFSAEFAQSFSGQCGDNLYWVYANDTLTITGTGAMYDERPWGLLVDKIQKIVLPTGITHIGNDAFQDCMGLRDIDLPYTLETIGDYSFNGCRRLITINCYPLLPPIAESTSFSNYSANLYAPCDNLDEYKYDMVFGQFKYFECIGSESVSTNGTVVTPGSTDVTITWPTDENADTYTIVIMKGDVIFCKLLFNKDGQLLNIAFTPGRDGQNRALYAAQTANGLRFTVTGLEEKTKYGYDVSSQDEENNTISSYTGEFTTQSTTAVDNITTNNASIQKVIRDGQLIIVRNGVEYNAVGQEM